MKQDSEDKLAHVLEALENPSSFTQEELKSLFTDKECLRYARTILYAKESLARQQIPQPPVLNSLQSSNGQKSSLLLPDTGQFVEVHIYTIIIHHRFFSRISFRPRSSTSYPSISEYIQDRSHV